MLNHRQEKVESLLTRLVGEFLNHEASPRSLITVTRIHFNEKTNRATVYLSVLPDSEEERALDFAKRKSSDLRESLKDKVKMRAIPVFDFILDIGEKNRQHIDEIAVETSETNTRASGDADSRPDSQ